MRVLLQADGFSDSGMTLQRAVAAEVPNWHVERPRAHPEPHDYVQWCVQFAIRFAELSTPSTDSPASE
jgi:hypothetical protein